MRAHEVAENCVSLFVARRVSAVHVCGDERDAHLGWVSGFGEDGRAGERGFIIYTDLVFCSVSRSQHLRQCPSSLIFFFLFFSLPSS